MKTSKQARKQALWAMRNQDTSAFDYVETLQHERHASRSTNDLHASYAPAFKVRAGKPKMGAWEDCYREDEKDERPTEQWTSFTGGSPRCNANNVPMYGAIKKAR